MHISLLFLIVGFVYAYVQSQTRPSLQ